MSGKRRLRKATQSLNIRKRDADTIYKGLLGTVFNGSEVVEVSGRDNFVWVRLNSNQSDLIQAFNRTVAPIFDYPVLVRRQKTNINFFEVIDVDKDLYMGLMGNSNVIPKHAPQHMFNPDAPGSDIVWAFDQQLMPLLVHPSGTSGSEGVVIEPDVYYQDGAWKFGGNTGTASIVAQKPTDNTAKMILIYLDSNSNPQLSAGSTFDATLTGTADVMPFVPTLGSTSDVPLAWARVVSGTSTILWENLYDARPWIVGDGVLSTGTSRHIIQDEGVSVPDRPFLDFQGNLVAVTDDGSNTTIVSVTGSSGRVIREEGADLPDQPALNFIGNGITAIDDPANSETRIYSTGTVTLSDAATLPEAQTGTSTTAYITPSTLPILLWNGGIVRRDQDLAGNPRGSQSTDLQASKNSNPNAVPAAPRSAILGGDGNVITGDSDDSYIGGGVQNIITGSVQATIGGGDRNKIQGSYEATIAGGRQNEILSDGGHSRTGFIGGGRENQIIKANYNAFIGAGEDNLIGYDADESVIGGGRINRILSSDKATLAGGERGLITGSYGGSIMGGTDNEIHRSSRGSILGGHDNNLYSGSSYATAGGINTEVYWWGSNVRSGGEIDGYNAQSIQLFWGQKTTDATQTEMFLDGFNNLFIPAIVPTISTWAFDVWVVARRVDTTDESAGYHFRGLIDRQVAIGTTALVGSVVKTVIAEDTAAWDVDVDANPLVGSLRIQVTGEVSKTIHWFAQGIISQVRSTKGDQFGLH